MKITILCLLLIFLSGCSYHKKTVIQGKDIRYGLATGANMTIYREVKINIKD